MANPLTQQTCREDLLALEIHRLVFQLQFTSLGMT